MLNPWWRRNSSRKPFRWAVMQMLFRILGSMTTTLNFNADRRWGQSGKPSALPAKPGILFKQRAAGTGQKY
jgi:hypothetical protein